MSSLFLDEIRWGNNDVIINDNDESNNIINDDFPIVFPIDHNMNKKIHLFCGDCMKLPADALVIGNYESLNYRGEDNGALFTLGGPSFEKDVEDIESCLTSNSVIVSGGNTVFNHVIFAIGPKYDINYKETCDSSLWGTYYSALNIATVYDNDPPIKTIAICSLYLKCKKYPRDLGAHVALRTIRKFISHAIGNKLERIILCCNNPDDYAIYQSLLPAYFPRSIEDAILQCDILPENVGNEWGEIISQHRSIKVTAGPRPSLDSTTMKPLSLPNSPNPAGGPIKTGNSNLNVTWKPPRKMSEVIADDDKHRIWRAFEYDKNMTEEERLRIKYDQLLQRIEAGEDLQDIGASNFISIIGRDRLGQSVVLITASHIKPNDVDMDRLLMYVMCVCEQFKNVPYSLIYAYSAVNEETLPSSEHLNMLFELFLQRYSLHLSKFFVLHPTASFRLYLAMPYSNRLWKSCICLDTINGLNPYMDISTIELPMLVTIHEVVMNN